MIRNAYPGKTHLTFREILSIEEINRMIADLVALDAFSKRIKGPKVSLEELAIVFWGRVRMCIWDLTHLRTEEEFKSLTTGTRSNYVGDMLSNIFTKLSGACYGGEGNGVCIECLFNKAAKSTSMCPWNHKDCNEKDTGLSDLRDNPKSWTDEGRIGNCDGGCWACHELVTKWQKRNLRVLPFPYDGPREKR